MMDFSYDKELPCHFQSIVQFQTQMTGAEIREDGFYLEFLAGAVTASNLRGQWAEQHPASLALVTFI